VVNDADEEIERSRCLTLIIFNCAVHTKPVRIIDYEIKVPPFTVSDLQRVDHREKVE